MRILLLVLLVIQLKTTAQNVERSFNANEEIVYQAFYQLGFFKINAGEVHFKVEESLFDDKAAYKLKATGTSHKHYDYFYMVRDTFTSYVSKETLSPFWFRRQTSEGGYTADLIYKYDYDKQIIYGRKIRKKEAPKDSVHVKPENCWDMMSVIYHLRELDFSNLNIGDRIYLNMIVDNEIEKDYHVTYMGLKNVKNLDGRKFRCIWFKPLLITGSAFNENHGMNIYLTDDRNHIPIIIDSNVVFGKVSAYLTEYKHLKYPLSSEIIK